MVKLQIVIIIAIVILSIGCVGTCFQVLVEVMIDQRTEIMSIIGIARRAFQTGNLASHSISAGVHLVT